jgi:hypothetical protein
MNNSLDTNVLSPTPNGTDVLAPPSSASSALFSFAGVPAPTQGLLMRMFADPRVLTKEEKTRLVTQLEECVALHPKVSNLRVLYGMALSVDLQVQDAMEELAEGVALDPNSFIAHYKMGELWMRLRVCRKAQDHTSYAATLAENMAQAEMARRQAAALRTMLREGVERDGYRTAWFSFSWVRRLWKRKRAESEALATADIS